ncbi:MAG TPA: UDP-N-acetylmuramate--L-alanine ligase [Candidatus Binatia bacterium]|jgi:UDP-N-acetylmuramate--alanine ligase|nr:UDP-N-acetylmuramate--L-alanine ligase [Candidatus Binatia bacterium]
MLHKKHKIHFVGIGGIGMSGIAEVLLNSGYVVSGSDLQESDATRRLRDLGAAVFVGHQEANLAGNPSVVVISTAVKYSNPEVLEARRRHIPVIPRAEMLAELMRMKYAVAVAGSHGKTTTTSMIAAVLSNARLDPTMVIGGRVHMLGTNARTGQGEFLVAEADESDGSFLLLSPTIAVVTNIDREHMDFHQTMERLNESFLAFINKIPFYGLAVLCIDDANVHGLLSKTRKRFATYGLSAEADFSAQDLKMSLGGVEFTVVHEGKPLGNLRLHLPGRHSATNALAAVAVAHELEIPFARAAEALAGFTGIHRRFEVKGEPRGIMVIDDYGHHPTEIRATIGAIRDSWKRPLTVIFQPHRFTRTRDLFDEFLTAFEGADRLVVTEIYPAGEDPIAGATGEALYQAMKRKGHMELEFVPDKNQIAAQLAGKLNPGDMVLTLGAGDIYKVGEALVEALK